MRARRLLVTSCLVAALAGGLGAQKAPAHGGLTSINPADLNEWLSYIASDELEGRQVYTEGLGLAAGYIADHLREWGVKPGGDNGSYFQTVKVVGVRDHEQGVGHRRRQRPDAHVQGRRRDHVPAQHGREADDHGDQIQFVGYGLQIPSAGIDDYAGVDPKGKIVIYLGQQGPKTMPSGSNRLLVARARNAVEKGAAAVIGVPGFGFGRGRGAAQVPPLRRRPARLLRRPPARLQPAATPAPQPAAQPAGRGRGNPPDDGDFTTVQRYDRPVAPMLTARDEFFEFLFSGSDDDVCGAEGQDRRSWSRCR